MAVPILPCCVHAERLNIQILGCDGSGVGPPWVLYGQNIEETLFFVTQVVP